MASKVDQLRALREARARQAESSTSPNTIRPSPNTSPNTIAPSPNAPHAGGYARNARWRAANPDKYRASQRALMRKRRAAATA